MLPFCIAKPLDCLPMKFMVDHCGLKWKTSYASSMINNPLSISLFLPLSIFSPSLSLSFSHSIFPSVYLSSFSFFCSFHLSLSLSVQHTQTRRKVRTLSKVSQRKMNMNAKKGEADRNIPCKMPKHLFAGKRKGGSTSRR